jgi:hypothetical protein
MWPDRTRQPCGHDLMADPHSGPPFLARQPCGHDSMADPHSGPSSCIPRHAALVQCRRTGNTTHEAVRDRCRGAHAG